MKNNLFSFLLLAGLLFAAGCAEKQTTLFRLLDSKKTGIEFNNDITEYDSLNILNSEFIYNGGGVAIGDLNGDGLQDLYFTGNQVENKLYLNKGELQFEDVTDRAHAQKKPGQWSAGINFVDLNQDGKLDIYVCNTFVSDPEKRQNLLLVNQGNDAAGIPQFEEMAAAYGIADTTHSANAQFFDCDNDGDLDLFVAVNFMDKDNPNQYFKKATDGSSPNRDRLYRNDWVAKVGHPVFTDISVQAGLKWDGYSHSSLVSDFNGDGWPDIYVANDYVTNDLIYVHDPAASASAYTNRIAGIFKHQAASAMGSDVADINNDGRLDLFTTEMLPYHNKRKKLFLNANNYSTYINNEVYGYEYQFSRNTLQLNRGIDAETGLPVFSDVAFMGNLQETEWSWTPLMADFDNDGNRDIFVTNGFPRDVTDHDFNNYRSTVSYLLPPMEMQEAIPQIKVPKFVFHNDGNLHFTDLSKQWGVDVPAFSNGAATGDLDNDGDLDLVVNNIDDKAFVFQNTQNDGPQKPNYLRLKIEGEAENPDAFGTEITAYFNGQAQKGQLLSARGYLSASENFFHLGLGATTKVDSVVLRWRGLRTATLKDLPINQVVTVRLTELPFHLAPGANNAAGLFSTPDPASLGLAFMHRDSDYIDFNYQVTLPHKFSEYGPGMSIGDANGDGLDDVYLSGSAREPGTWLLQTKQGRFTRKDVAYKTDAQRNEEELGTLLFDADGDGDNDLYIVHGGNQDAANSPNYQDVLCVNDGKGNFSVAPNALPKETACGQAVKAADFDRDGDLDLFVGGRVTPRSYPKTDRSFILRNDSKGKDKPVFTDVTDQVCPELAAIGLISDALWTDFNGDNQPDLLLAGEWMPLTFLQNEGGKLKNVTTQTGISDKTGWWTSLAAADFDNDGDVDYTAGNFGENVYYKCQSGEPLSIYAKDFDGNGFYDPFISCFWPDSAGNRHEYLYNSRDDILKQLIKIRKRFNTYGALGEATVQDIFKPEDLKDAQIMHVDWMSTSFIENLGGGRFKISALPAEAQVAPVQGMLPYDVDHDGLLDLLMVGNDYGMELLQGRADAFCGLVLKNMGKNVFQPLDLEKSRFYVPYNARGLARLNLGGQDELILATQHGGPLKIFAPRMAAGMAITLKTNEAKAVITLKNGAQRVQELYWGSTFMSQESRTVWMDGNVRDVSFFDRNNKQTRIVVPTTNPDLAK
ncbi:MAG TPA: VCBS repeat-containing protein [Saprospiraceae bacterium]|nr:VCBS repeat-containing protein [Saprospiraceae bacterium]HPI05933.1 VCBS repeat-containing protein [Saprospiraceae bacterium]